MRWNTKTGRGVQHSDECDDGKVWAEDADVCPTTCEDATHEDVSCVSDEDTKPGCRCPGSKYDKNFVNLTP